MKIEIFDVFKNLYGKIFQTIDYKANQYSQRGAVNSTRRGGVPVFTKISHDSVTHEYDEQHHFYIPFEDSAYRFALYTLRNLPAGVSESNDLPKKRIFHFSGKSDLGNLRAFLMDGAQCAAGNGASNRQDASETSLGFLANTIDALNYEFSHGILLVGFPIALVNPEMLASIAAKAFQPMIVKLLRKSGVVRDDEKVSERILEERVRHLQQSVRDAFMSAETTSHVNPILTALCDMLGKSVVGHDAPLGQAMPNQALLRMMDSPWRDLTVKAIFSVYEDVLFDPEKRAAAKIGPEAFRWFESLSSCYKSLQN